MALELAVLGSSGGYAGPGKACSGYLLRDGVNSLALDLGSGTLSNLQRYVRPDELGALILTHMHYDHYVDIYGLCTARRFWESELPALPCLAPADALSVIASPLSEGSVKAFMRCLGLTVAESGETYQFPGFEVIAESAEHREMDAYSYRVSAGGRSVCYTGDTDATDEVVELARGVDLLVCESTFTSQVPFKMPGHLTASEAGELAEKAGAGRLILTHIWPTLDEGTALMDARSKFGGEVVLAVEGFEIPV